MFENLVLLGILVGLFLLAFLLGVTLLNSKEKNIDASLNIKIYKAESSIKIKSEIPQKNKRIDR